MNELYLVLYKYRITKIFNSPFHLGIIWTVFHLIQVFVTVVDYESFARAARKLAISPPAVTRAVNELEGHLGLRLLTRTTRSVRVTDA
jgi:hypothetical protein